MKTKSNKSDIDQDLDLNGYHLGFELKNKINQKGIHFGKMLNKQQYKFGVRARNILLIIIIAISLFYFTYIFIKAIYQL